MSATSSADAVAVDEHREGTRDWPSWCDGSASPHLAVRRRCPRLARRRQHLLQPLADEAAAADGAGEQVGIVAVVDLAVIEFFERLLAVAPRHVSCAFRGPPARRPDCRPPITFLARMTPNTAGGFVEGILARRDGQRRCGRVAAARQHRDRPASSARPAAGHRWRRAPGAPRWPGSAWPPGMPDQCAHDVGGQAVRRDQ